jgi:hypothetical protein
LFIFFRASTELAYLPFAFLPVSKLPALPPPYMLGLRDLVLPNVDATGATLPEDVDPAEADSMMSLNFIRIFSYLLLVFIN